jgi:hypothetical protein
MVSMEVCMPGHAIIGIHGLSRKPPPEPHKADWIAALCEGLRRNHGLNLAAKQFALDLVYWADWLGLQPYAEGEDEEPYEPAGGDGPLPSYRDRWHDEILSKGLGLAGAKVDELKTNKALELVATYVGFDKISTEILKVRLVDLATYYSDEGKRDDLRVRLRKKLEDNKDKRIMLIAHSMGSIVAYDVLRNLGRDMPGLEISHLVTIGSPLGLPYVLQKIREENASIRTPSIVKRWTNLADRRDPVAVDVHLQDEFEPNDQGVAVEDRLIINTYVSPRGKQNFHKIYGYLRAPEMTSVVKAFI